MPCDQINTMSVAIEAADRELLVRALERLGLKYAVAADGTVTVRVAPGATIAIGASEAVLSSIAFTRVDLQTTLNQIKDQYTRVVVEEAASQYGWNLVDDDEEEGQYLLRKYD